MYPIIGKMYPIVGEVLLPCVNHIWVGDVYVLNVEVLLPQTLFNPILKEPNLSINFKGEKIEKDFSKEF